MSATCFAPSAEAMAFMKKACYSPGPAASCCSIDIPDLALERIISFVDCPRTRSSISLVCKKWHDMENYTRKDVTVAFCYTTSPSRLSQRFTKLQSLKVKGKPRADMFNLMPENWGAYAEPWVKEIATNCAFLHSLHFRRMAVSDADLKTIAQTYRNRLTVLKLDRCAEFSTIGLEHITNYCRQLRVLFLDESSVTDLSGNWLNQLARHNSSLEVLSFHATCLSNIDVASLEAIAMNCRSLTTLKVSDIELSRLSGMLNRATALRELAGVSLSGNAGLMYGQGNGSLSLPRGLTSLGLIYMGDDDSDSNVIPLIEPLAPELRKLDLQLAGLSLEGHRQLLQNFKNLNVLEVLNGIGDEGLDVVGANCRNLTRLRVESGDRDFQQGYVTHRGLIAIALGCNKLEYIAVYMSEINNAALEALGEGCPKLRDFRLVLLLEEFPSLGRLDFPLDHGVRALLEGCCDLTRLALYLKPGALTNTGMKLIGKLGKKLRWALLGLLGDSDEGFSWLADGCPKLERLEMRDCVFSEAGIARSLLKLPTLKYVWVQGYKGTPYGQDLLAMRSKPFWNIEFIPEQWDTRLDHEDLNTQQFSELTKPAQFLAYNSLAGKRQDCPKTVLQLA